jgi:predicted nucleotidyltransferase
MNFEEIAVRNSICKIRVGSHLYGTKNPTSDEDFAGIFIPNEDLLFGMQNCEQVQFKTNKSDSGHKNTEEDTDYTIYNIKKFFTLAAKASPSILEILFANEENIVSDSFWFKMIREAYPKFVTKQIFNSFMGYAIGQEKLLKTKTIRYMALLKMKEYLDTKNNFYPFLSQEMCDMLKSIYPDYRNKDGSIKQFTTDTRFDYTYENIKREIEHYGYRKEFILEYGYETKFGSHLLRLILEGIELGSNGKLEFPLKYADKIKNIKEGKVPEKEFYETVAHYKNVFRNVEQRCELPETADMNGIDDILIYIIKNYLNVKKG